MIHRNPAQRVLRSRQVSLRVALLCALTIVVAFGVLGARVARLRQTRAAVRALQGMGGRVTLDRQSIRERLAADWLERVGMADAYDRVVFVAFHGADDKRWTVAEMQEYGEQATPQQLSRWDPWTLENVLGMQPHLEASPHLRALSFCRTTIPSGGLAAIAHLRRLQRLDLSATQIRNDDLRFLAKLSDLELLGLQRNPIDSHGMVHLRKLSKLVHLDLRETEVDDEATTQLAVLPNLQLLDLADTHITDRGVRQLSQLDSLRNLNLGGTTVSDHSIDFLGSLPQLQELVVGSQVTMEGLERLQAALPGCVIRRHAGRKSPLTNSR